MNNTGKWVLISVCTVIALIIIVNAVIWLLVANSNFENRKIRPMDKYTLRDKEYQVPNLPLIGSPRILKRAYLETQHRFLTDVCTMLRASGREFWISGGTLLGFTRHRTFIPWDDDCDVHTKWENRRYFYSTEFADLAYEYDLEIIFLRGASMQKANRNGAAVRIRKIGSITPILDMFFVKEVPETEHTWAKINSWNGDKLEYSEKERWSANDMFPVVDRMVDDIYLPFPFNPEAMLTQQYGPTALTKMYAPSFAVSHLYPFFLRFIWRTQPTSHGKRSKAKTAA